MLIPISESKDSMFSSNKTSDHLFGIRLSQQLPRVPSSELINMEVIYINYYWWKTHEKRQKLFYCIGNKHLWRVYCKLKKRRVAQWWHTTTVHQQLMLRNSFESRLMVLYGRFKKQITFVYSNKLSTKNTRDKLLFSVWMQNRIICKYC